MQAARVGVKRQSGLWRVLLVICVFLSARSYQYLPNKNIYILLKHFRVNQDVVVPSIHRCAGRPACVAPRQAPVPPA